MVEWYSSHTRAECKLAATTRKIGWQLRNRVAASRMVYEPLDYGLAMFHRTCYYFDDSKLCFI